MGSKLNRVIYSCERIKGELMVKAIYKEEERLPDFLSEEVKRTGNYAMYLQNLLQSITEGRSKVSNYNPFYINFELHEIENRLEIRSNLYAKYNEQFKATHTWHTIVIDAYKINNVLHLLLPKAQ